MRGLVMVAVTVAAFPGIVTTGAYRSECDLHELIH